MTSHKNGLGVSITDKRGLHVFFGKKKTDFNICVGKALRGKGGNMRANFRAAVQSCKGSRAK